MRLFLPPGSIAYYLLRSTFGLLADAFFCRTFPPEAKLEWVHLKSSSKTQKSYFCLSFLLISNSFLQHYSLRHLWSRVGRQCQSTTQFLHGILWSWHEDPCANAIFCPWRKRDFHQRSAPSLSSRCTLIQLHCFLCCYTTRLTSLTSWNTSVVASVRCYTPAVTHHGITPRYPTIYLFS